MGIQIRGCFPIILVLITIIGCGDELEKVQVFNADGVLEQEFKIDVDSFKQGIQRSYFSNGRDIFEQAEYLDDRLHGTRILYYSSGQAEVVENYLQDILMDTLYIYFESGVLKMKSYYDKGVHSGVNTLYFESGNIKEEVIMADNMEQGPFVEYHENGEVKWRGQYFNGDSEIGELIQYDEEGVVIKKMNCDSLGICATVWTIEKGDIAPTYVRQSN